MKVTVVFDFPQITDPDGDMAGMLIEAITDDTNVWATQYTTAEGGKCDVYVEEAA